MIVASAQASLSAIENFDKNDSVFPTYGTAESCDSCRRMLELHGTYFANSHLAKYCHK